MEHRLQSGRGAPDFIYDIHPLPQIRFAGVALAAAFNVAAYSDALYEVLGVSFPAHLARAVAKRKAEFLCGRFLAALAFERLGAEHQEIGTGEHREPLWPANICGSLSHTHDRVACLLSCDARLGLGIDLENIQADEGARNLSRMVIGEAEHALLNACSEPFGLCFTTVFSAKESLFKALYPRVRRYFDFHAARVIRIDLAQGLIVMELTQDLAQCYRAQDRFELGVTLETTRVLTYLVHEAPGS